MKQVSALEVLDETKTAPENSEADENLELIGPGRERDGVAGMKIDMKN